MGKVLYSSNDSFLSTHGKMFFVISVDFCFKVWKALDTQILQQMPAERSWAPCGQHTKQIAYSDSH